MKITLHTWPDIADQYPALFARCFNEPFNPMDAPAVVLVGENEQGLVGFLSGYYHNQETLYIQRIGLNHPLLQGTPVGKNAVMEVFDFACKAGIRYFLGLVENTNLRALTVALKAGFRIIGTRMDTNGKLYVELIKEIRI